MDDEGVEYHLLCIPDLVQAKKTQRSKDWPVIELLVTIHYRQHASEATDEQVDFWLHEARTPQLLVELCRRFPTQAAEVTASRPLIRLARDRSLDDLRTALDAEVRAEQARDRDYWEPLRRELEQFHREHHGRERPVGPGSRRPESQAEAGRERPAADLKKRARSSRAAHQLAHRCGSAIGQAILDVSPCPLGRGAKWPT